MVGDGGFCKSIIAKVLFPLKNSLGADITNRPLYEGHGWDYPYQVNTQSLSTAARYVAHTE